MSIPLYGCTKWTLTKRMKKKKRLTAITQECCEQYWTSTGGSTPQGSSCVATYHPSGKLSKLVEPDMRDTAGEVTINSWAIYSCGPHYMDEQRRDDRLETIYNCRLEDLPRTMNDRDGWWERVGEIHPGGLTWWWWWSMQVIILGGARGVMVIVVGIGHGNTSSNPGRDWLHFT